MYYIQITTQNREMRYWEGRMKRKMNILIAIGLISLGAVIGVTTICLMQSAGRYDRKMEECERKKDEHNEIM